MKEIKLIGGGLPIKNNTKLGYLIAYDGDAIDISPRMIYHRGTVQHGICQTLKTHIDVGVLLWENTESEN